MGTIVPIRMLEVLDSETPVLEPFIVAKVDADVHGSDGGLALPAGSNALLTVVGMGKVKGISSLSLALYSVDVNGHQYRFIEGDTRKAVAVFTEDGGNGAMHRTVHLSESSVVNFKLVAPVQLR